MGDQEIAGGEGNFRNYQFLHKLHPKDGKINRTHQQKLNMDKNTLRNENINCINCLKHYTLSINYVMTCNFTYRKGD
jgi:hypothetical protein